MKKCLQKVFSLIKRLFLFLKLHIHVEAGIRGSNREKSNNEDSDDPEVKE